MNTVTSDSSFNNGDEIKIIIWEKYFYEHWLQVNSYEKGVFGVK